MRSILVVDDEDVIRELLLRCLRTRGYSILTASDGEEAMGILSEQDIDLVIMDLKMPGMGGMELIEEIKKINAGCKIILVTGYATPDTAQQAIAAGCCKYFSKPFDIEVLLTSVQQLLG